MPSEKISREPINVIYNWPGMLSSALLPHSLYPKAVPTPKQLAKGKEIKPLQFQKRSNVLNGDWIKRLLELHQTGLIGYWDLWFRPMPRKCISNVKSGYAIPKNKHPPLSLKNLTGAFLVLSVGLSLSLLAFLCEQVFSMDKRHRRRNGRPVKATPDIADLSCKTVEDV